MLLNILPLIFFAVAADVSGIVDLSYSPVKKQMGHFFVSIWPTRSRVSKPPK